MMQLILKVSSRCNLNCSYCYVYHKADGSWRRRPALMPDTVFQAALRQALRYCRDSGTDRISLCFHGGEPCLIGVRRFRSWCGEARRCLQGLDLRLSVQTNGTRIDADWIAAFGEFDVGVGVSIDGPPAVHDRNRVDHAGRGSHARVAAGLELLRGSGLRYGLLCVIPLGEDPLAVHRHLAGLGAPTVTYLLPDFTHDTIAPVRARFGPTPCADFLIPIFEHWYAGGDAEIRVQDLWNLCRLVLGGRSTIETLGGGAAHYFFVESDGAIEGLDALRVCEEGIGGTRLNVLRNGFAAVRECHGLPAEAIFRDLPLPTACRGCDEAATCAGGHLPHRFSAARGFDNESVWCADLRKLFGHVRRRLGVSPAGTARRRSKLDRIRQTAAASGPARAALPELAP